MAELVAKLLGSITHVTISLGEHLFQLLKPWRALLLLAAILGIVAEE
jgi:hypothetical protein